MKVLAIATKSSLLSIFADNKKNMLGYYQQRSVSSKNLESKSSLSTTRKGFSGIKVTKISNISCFIKYEVLPE